MRRLRLSSHARALNALAQLTAGQPRLAGAKGHLRSACGVNGSIPAPKVARPADPDRRERDIAHAHPSVDIEAPAPEPHR